MRTSSLEFSIGRDFGLLYNWKPEREKILEFSIGRDFGALKGLTHYRLSVALGFANRTLMTTESRACSSDCHVSFYSASDLILGVLSGLLSREPCRATKKESFYHKTILDARYDRDIKVYHFLAETFSG